jgi:hypothetical protein
MIRLVVGDEGDEIRVQVTIGHPQTVCYHSEPFGKTCRRAQVVSLRTGSTKRGIVILSPAQAGLLRMTYKYQGSGWILQSKLEMESTTERKQRRAKKGPLADKL